MTRLTVILGVLALAATASSVQAGLPEGPPDVHTDGDSRCNISDDGNSSTGSCCVGNSDGSVSCVIETVTTVPSADFKIVPRRKFPPQIFGARPFFPPNRVYPKLSRWPLVPTAHLQRPLRFSGSVIAHAPVPLHRFSSSVISRAAFVSHPSFVSHPAFAGRVAFASRASFGRSFGRIR